MKNFWKNLILPLFNKIQPKTIVEIGCDRGINTKNILNDYCIKKNAKLYSVDPKPHESFDINQLKKEFSNNFVFYQNLSLEVLPFLNDFDIILIDGDHNWYTVFNELKTIESNFNQNSFPFVIFHDVSWPYARRDCYYNPETIPPEFRNEYKKGGMLPEVDELKDFGLNIYFNNAIHENTPKNGVLTAIEDFIKETNLDLSFYSLNVFYGLGILCANTEYNKKIIMNLFYESDMCGILENIYQKEKFYKDNTINQINFKLSEQTNINKNLETKLTEQTNINKNLETKLTEQTNINKNLETKLTEQTNINKNLETKLTEQTNINKNLETKLTEQTNINKNLETKLTEQTNINKNLETKLTEQTNINKNLETKLTEQTNINKNLETKLTEQTNINKNLETKLSKLSNNNDNLELKLSELKDNMDKNTLIIDKLNKINKNQKFEIADLKDDKIQLIQDNKSFLNEMQNSRTYYENEIITKDESIEKLNKEIEKQNIELSDSKNEINRIKNELSSSWIWKLIKPFVKINLNNNEKM